MIAGKDLDPCPLHAAGTVINVHDNDKATCLGWTIGDETIIAGFDSGLLVKYDAQTGKEVARSKTHSDRVNRLQFNKDKTMLITASRDCNSKLVDPHTLEVVKTYKTDRPVNGASIAPCHPHILLGGGQDGEKTRQTPLIICVI
jgi:translation initiation factor 3 subunit I